MKTFFEEHGGAIITVTVIVAILGILTVLTAVDGPVQKAMIGLINTLLNQAGAPIIPVS